MPDTKEIAQELFNSIEYGKENAVKRPANGKVDREFRNLIEEACNNGVNIINSGQGYYVPLIKDRPDEKSECLRYMDGIRSRRDKHSKRYAAQMRAIQKELSDQIEMDDYEWDI